MIKLTENAFISQLGTSNYEYGYEKKKELYLIDNIDHQFGLLLDYFQKLFLPHLWWHLFCALFEKVTVKSVSTRGMLRNTWMHALFIANFGIFPKHDYDH